MNKYKRALAGILISSFALGVFGCGEEKKTAVSETTETAETTETTAEETTEAEETTTAETSGKTAEDKPEEVNNQVANPWIDVSEEEFIEIMGEPLVLPEGAFDASYRVCTSEPPLGEVVFHIYSENTTMTARVQATDKETDVSGLYYSWNRFSDRCGSVSITDRSAAADGMYIQSAIWYDDGRSYSLSIMKEDLDGFDIGAVVSQMIVMKDPTGINAIPDTEAGKAYKDAIYYYVNTGILPDGIYMDSSDSKFAVADIDHDDELELIIYVLSKHAPSKLCLIYKYSENGPMINIFAGFPSIRVLTNGDILENWSHNTGPGEMWPFNIYVIDGNTGEYILYAQVDSWNKKGNEIFHGEEYPDWADTDGAGVVYSVMFPDTGNYLHDSMYVSKSVYEDFFSKEAGEANEIELDFFTV